MAGETLGRLPRKDPHRRRPLRSLLALVPALLLAMAGAGLAAPALDRGFGEDGVARTPLPASYRDYLAATGRGPLIEDLALQKGRMVAALGSGTEFTFLGAARYRADGKLDRGFADAGYADLERYFRGVAGEAQGEAIAVQRDRKIIVAGYRGDSVYRESVPHRAAPLLARLLPNGRPDRSFGPKGLVSPTPRGTNGEVLHGVALQRNGRIVTVGARNERRGGEPAGLVIAYRPNGKLDRRFGRRGRVLFPNRHHADYTALRDIEALPSGKLLVVGYVGDRFFLARLRPNGKLDRSFGGGDGKVLLGDELGGCCPSEAELEVLPGGDILALSAPLGGSQTVFRFHPNGSLERSFGRRGALRGAWMRRVGEAGGLAVQGDGRIVIVGTAGRLREDRTGKTVLSILRALPNGKPDRGFGRRGTEFLSFGRNAVGTAALSLADGRALVGGGAQLRAGPGVEGDFEYELVLARLRR